MTDLFKTSRNSSLFDDILPEKGNMDIGFFRVDKTIVLNQGKSIHLKGPPISVYHPSEYDSSTYRALTTAPATYEVFKYGIVGIRNITAGTWVTTTIDYIDKTRTTIYLTGAGTSSNDEVLVYYYASSPSTGGDMNNLQGDILTPDSLDMLTKALNDAMPSIYTQYGDADGSPIFHYGGDMAYNTGLSPVAGSWTELIDTTPATTGTFRWVGFPVYIAEIVIKSTWSTFTYIDFRITVDGSTMTSGFDDTTIDYIRWASLDPENYPTGSSYDRHPGKLFGSLNEPLFFDSYEDDDGKMCWRIGLTTEVVSSLKIEVKPDTYSLLNAECYVRGWHVPA